MSYLNAVSGDTIPLETKAQEALELTAVLALVSASASS